MTELRTQFHEQLAELEHDLVLMGERSQGEMSRKVYPRHGDRSTVEKG